MAAVRRAERIRTAITAMDKSRIWSVSFGSWLLERHASALGDVPGDAGPSIDLSGYANGLDDMEVRSARSGWGDDPLVGRQFAVWSLRSADAVWACLWRVGRSDRSNGVDGVLHDDLLSRGSLER